MNAVTTLVGGLGLFLLGMWLMTGGLKLAAGDALRSLLTRWTGTPLRGLSAGVLITAIVQSSSAVTVATIGFVNAGLLTLGQAVYVIFGANVGTTMTAWLVAFVGVKIDVGLFALPLVGVGMLIRLVTSSNMRLSGLGEALAGFGIFFLGVGVLQQGFENLAPQITKFDLTSSGGFQVAAFVGLGIVLTLLTQSSSAAIAIALTASASGEVPLELAAATVVGTNIGTTSTAFFASLGATPSAKRVASAHISFNVLSGVAALALLPILLFTSRVIARLFEIEGDIPATLAIFHTLFNCIGVGLIWYATPWLIRTLATLYVSSDEQIGRPRHLDENLAQVPALAVNGLMHEVLRMRKFAFALARERTTHPESKPMEHVRQQRGIMDLGQYIRDFIQKLGSQALPPDARATLPNIVRAVQHLESVVDASGQMISALPPEGILRSETWIEFRSAVLATLDFGPGGRSDRSIDQHNDRSTQVEKIYQQIKADLLAAAASGELAVRSVDRALLHAQQLRRMADAATKTARRLAVKQQEGGPENGGAPPARE